jgi:hypothetical protein
MRRVSSLLNSVRMADDAVGASDLKPLVVRSPVGASSRRREDAKGSNAQSAYRRLSGNNHT